jgi:hypothetical protein
VIVISIIGTSIAFSFVFLSALGKYPFPDNQLTIFGLYFGLAAGISWAISVYRRSGVWNEVFNFLAAGLTVLSLAYVTAINFEKDCGNDSAPLCYLAKWAAARCNRVLPFS